METRKRGPADDPDVRLARGAARPVELSVKFMRPTRGRSVDAYAIALKRAEGLAFMEGELWSESKLCAVATGIVSTARGVAED